MCRREGKGRKGKGREKKRREEKTREEERREELVPSMFNHCLENFGGVGVVV